MTIALWYGMWYGRGRTGRTSCYGPGQKAQVLVLDAK